MPRPAIEGFWREQIRTLSANNQKAGPGRIHRLLTKVGAAVGRNDWPSERTIGREIHRFRAAAESERADYREFRWPESMEREDLPWEAAPFALEALRHVHQEQTQLKEDLIALVPPSIDYVGRPLVSHIRWFWRVSVARPDVELEQRWTWACIIANVRSGTVDSDLDSVEMEMAIGPLPGDADHDPDQLWFGSPLPWHRGFRFGSELDAYELLGWRFRWRKEPTGEKEDRRTWEPNAQTEKALSTGEPTDAGAGRSRSRKGGAGTSRTKTAKKSRGS
jgi:hypothetical protein